VLDAERKLARFTAVNIDGGTTQRLKREQDHWSLDPRVPVEQQTGEPVYADNALDRGHLVRRLDPAWGSSSGEAKLANDDTFHFTNCTPQHEHFNQNKTTWAGLEDYVLENADNRDLRVNVFSGPVLADDDDEYRGVKLPRQFWKVVTMVKGSGALSATGYLLSQEQLLHDGGFEALKAPEEFSYGAYRTFQVPLAQLETLTGLSFGPLGAADPLAGLESTAAAAARPVERVEDIVL
jgi:endonuclease G, mitochondrial